MKKGVLISICCAVGLAILIGGGWAWRYYTAPIEGKMNTPEE